MYVDTNVLDLIDAIANRELTPVPYSGRNMYGRECVACSVPRGSDMEGLPKAGAVVDQLGLDYIVYWPDVPWNDVVQKYVDMITDSSGDAK